MKLKGFIWTILAMALGLLLVRVFTSADFGGIAASYFGATLILFAVGFELVRSELADLRRGIIPKAEPKD